MISIGFAIGLGIGLFLTTGLLLWSFVVRARLEREIKHLERVFRLDRFESVEFQVLSDIAKCCYQTARAKGWWDDYDKLSADQIAARLCLIHSEVSEALEDVRVGRLETEQPRDAEGKLDKPVGFPTELADIVIRAFDLAIHLEVDIGREMATKMLYNTMRPHRHGGKAL